MIASCPEPVDVTGIPFRCQTSIHCVAGQVCHQQYKICAPPGWPYVDGGTSQDVVTGSNEDAGPNTCRSTSDCARLEASECTFWSCNQTSGQCVEVVKKDKCRIDDRCHSDGATSPDDECKRCFSSSSPTAWVDTICPPNKTCNPETGLCEANHP